jgi:hypothetical protein
MVTGIEVTGLALATFPIVVKGVSFYLDAATKVKEIRNYEGVLERLVRQLEMEKTKFENTCEFLLEAVLPADRVAALVGGDLKAWEDSDFQDALAQCLRTNTATAFTKAVAALNMSLRRLVERIGLDENRQVCHVHYTTTPSVRLLASEN